MERDSELEAILLGLAGALPGAMVGGLVDHYFFNLDFPHSVSLCWLYAALTVVAIRISEEAGLGGEEAEAARKGGGAERAAIRLGRGWQLGD
jgi:hypothetical protein